MGIFQIQLYYENALTLPLFAHMTFKQQDKIVSALTNILL